MNIKDSSWFWITLSFTPVILLCACGSPPPPQPVVETLVVEHTVQAPPEQVIRQVTPTSEPAEDRSLTICRDWVPDTLFLHGTKNAAPQGIWEIIYDGPIDNNSYGYQPVILEKIPNLADGDAVLNAITVNEGDTVVDASGAMVSLQAEAETPVMLVPAGGGEPVAYQGGEFEMDQLAVTFELLPNLTWSDGTPLTASDSVFNFNLLEEPEFGGIDLWLHTAAYEALDERTLVWTGLPGFMDGTYFLNFLSPLPEHELGAYTPAELYTADESAVTPLGWGPYRIEEHIVGDQIILGKNPHYFLAGEGLPRFDTLTIKFITGSPEARISALLSGECDLVPDIPAEHLGFLLALQDAGLVRTQISETTIFEQISFFIQPDSYDDGYQVGIDRPDYFSDLRTRQAIAMCLDRQGAADLATFDTSAVLDTYIPGFHPLYNDQVPQYPYDPQAGMALLDQAGWVDHDDEPATARISRGVPNVPDGTPLQFQYLSTRPYSSVLEESLIECGIHARLEVLTPAGMYHSDSYGDIYYRADDFLEFGWNIGARPPCYLYLSSAVPGPVGESWISIMDSKERNFLSGDDLNITGFADQAYDAACQTALSTLPGQPGYIEAHHAAQRLYAQLLPSIPLFSHIQFVATRPDMCNVILDPTGGGRWNVEEFDYGEGCLE